MYKEIEVKAKVNDLQKVRAELEKQGAVFSEPIIQEDAVFTDYKGLFI
jgi:adenylate cyclase class IV